MRDIEVVRFVGVELAIVVAGVAEVAEVLLQSHSPFIVVWRSFFGKRGIACTGPGSLSHCPNWILVPMSRPLQNSLSIVPRIERSVLFCGDSIFVRLRIVLLHSQCQVVVQ